MNIETLLALLRPLGDMKVVILEPRGISTGFQHFQYHCDIDYVELQYCTMFTTSPYLHNASFYVSKLESFCEKSGASLQARTNVGNSSFMYTEENGRYIQLSLVR